MRQIVVRRDKQTLCNNNRIKYLSFGVFCVVFLCLHACTPSVNKPLQEAERLIKTKPDSAFHILNDMQEDEARMNDVEKALFGYLYLRIRDGKGPKDSVDINRIDFSIDYYRKHTDKQRLAGCYLDKARIFKDKAA